MQPRTQVVRLHQIIGLVAGICAMLGAAGGPGASSSAAEPPTGAPSFPAGLEWLNTDRPLRLEDLRGKVVLLDFWTFCCINCMHVIPDLDRLEAKYPDELVVIGVHSAKFTTERETENIRQAILRYGIRHPVVNDRDLVVWDAYHAAGWPTQVLIDPDGRIVTSRSGEGAYDALDGLIGDLVRKFDAAGRIDRTPLRLRLEQARSASAALWFPGKVVADAASGLLFIADSGHNRLLAVSPSDGAVRHVIGDGRAGLADGSFEQAEFRNPQGMAISGGLVYAADTDNHALRLVDLARRTVTTIAGDGHQASVLAAGGGPADSTRLSSPWDLVLHDDGLYIAMAGLHQVWRLDLKTKRIGPYVGTGFEGLHDGPLPAANLAQPSGITTDGAKLYFADSEDSSIRSADLPPGGRVETIVGGGLFDFGDIDGPGRQARLQHPLGVTWSDGIVYVADTYNNKVKRIRLADGTCEAFLGTGQAGLRDGESAEFDEPGGLSALDGKLYIADTNNHEIRVADLRTRQVTTLQVKEPELALPGVTAFSRLPARTLQLPPCTVRPGPAQIVLSVDMPKEFKLNADAPHRVSVTSSDPSVLSFHGSAETKVEKPTFPLAIPFDGQADTATITLDLVIYYCDTGNESLCRIDQARLTTQVKVEAGAAGEVRVPYSPPEQQPPPGSGQ